MRAVEDRRARSLAAASREIASLQRRLDSARRELDRHLNPGPADRGASPGRPSEPLQGFGLGEAAGGGTLEGGPGPNGAAAAAAAAMVERAGLGRLAAALVDRVSGALPRAERMAEWPAGGDGGLARAGEALQRAMEIVDGYSAVVELRLGVAACAAVCAAAGGGAAGAAALAAALRADVRGTLGVSPAAVRVAVRAGPCHGGAPSAAVVLSAAAGGGSGSESDLGDPEDSDEDGFLLFGPAHGGGVCAASRDLDYAGGGAAAAAGNEVLPVDQARGPRALAQRLVDAIRARRNDRAPGVPAAGAAGGPLIAGASFLGLAAAAAAQSVAGTHGCAGWVLQCETEESRGAVHGRRLAAAGVAAGSLLAECSVLQAELVTFLAATTTWAAAAGGGNKCPSGCEFGPSSVLELQECWDGSDLRRTEEQKGRLETDLELEWRARRLGDEEGDQALPGRAHAAAQAGVANLLGQAEAVSVLAEIRALSATFLDRIGGGDAAVQSSWANMGGGGAKIAVIDEENKWGCLPMILETLGRAARKLDESPAVVSLQLGPTAGVACCGGATGLTGLKGELQKDLCTALRLRKEAVRVILCQRHGQQGYDGLEVAVIIQPFASEVDSGHPGSIPAQASLGCCSEASVIGQSFVSKTSALDLVDQVENRRGRIFDTLSGSFVESARYLGLMSSLMAPLLSNIDTNMDWINKKNGLGSQSRVTADEFAESSMENENNDWIIMKNEVGSQASQVPADSFAESAMKSELTMARQSLQCTTTRLDQSESERKMAIQNLSTISEHICVLGSELVLLFDHFRQDLKLSHEKVQEENEKNICNPKSPAASNMQTELAKLKKEMQSRIKELKHKLKLSEQELQVICHSKRQMEMRFFVENQPSQNNQSSPNILKTVHDEKNNNVLFHAGALPLMPGQVCQFDVDISQNRPSNCTISQDSLCPMVTIEFLQKQVSAFESALKTSEDSRTSLFQRLETSLAAVYSYKDQVSAIESAREIEKESLQKTSVTVLNLDAEVSRFRSEVLFLQEKMEMTKNQSSKFQHELINEQTRVLLLYSAVRNIISEISECQSLIESLLYGEWLWRSAEHNSTEVLLNESQGLMEKDMSNVDDEKSDLKLAEGNQASLNEEATALTRHVAHVIALNNNAEERMHSQLMKAESKFLSLEKTNPADLEAVKTRESFNFNPEEFESQMHSNSLQNSLWFLLQALSKSESSRTNLFHRLDLALCAADALNEEISALEAARNIDREIRQTNATLICDLETRLSTTTKELSLVQEKVSMFFAVQ